MKSKNFITGISDFHALTANIMKLTQTKDNPKIKFYKDYKNVDNDLFKVDLRNGLRNLTDLTYTSFEEVFLRTLESHALIKTDLNQSNYEARRNFCTNLLRKTKK